LQVKVDGAVVTAPREVRLSQSHRIEVAATA
jgi:hypothetical protein